MTKPVGSIYVAMETVYRGGHLSQHQYISKSQMLPLSHLAPSLPCGSWNSLVKLE